MNGISEMDVERFTEGDCHYLARALHMKTNWPMVAFVEKGIPSMHAWLALRSFGTPEYGHHTYARAHIVADRLIASLS